MINADIQLKTIVDVAHMKRPSKVIETIMNQVRSIIVPGISTLQIDRYCADLMKKNRVSSALLGYNGYPYHICTSVNNVAAHGFPDDYELVQGDIITIDISIELNGWYSDCAWTFTVGKPSPDHIRLIKATWQAMINGIAYAQAGRRLGDIGAVIQKTAYQYGCSVIEDFSGHGIGEQLHEEPKVPNIGTPHAGLSIVPGMVFTVEPILSLGSPDVTKLQNGWTYVTADQSSCAQFEHTIAVFKNRTEILTFSQNNIQKHIDFPPYF